MPCQGRAAWRAALASDGQMGRKQLSNDASPHQSQGVRAIQSEPGGHTRNLDADCTAWPGLAKHGRFSTKTQKSLAQKKSFFVICPKP